MLPSSLHLVLLGLGAVALGTFVVLQWRDRSFTATVHAWFPDGSVKRVSPAGHGKFYEPHVHPEGTRVVYFGNTAGPLQLWETDLGTRATKPLTPPDFSARHPSYSSSGDRIAFAANLDPGERLETIDTLGKDGAPAKGRSLHIHIMDADGTHRQQITSGNFQDQRPCFSPDGSTITFVSDRDGSTRLWSVPADGSSPPRQLVTDGHAYRPCYSVDGQWVYFFRIGGGRHQLHRVPSAGGPSEPVANDTLGLTHGPFCEPTGKSILVHAFRQGMWGLWEIPLDGSAPRPLDPPGHDNAAHATKAKNGVITFDIATNRSWLRRTGAKVKRTLLTKRERR